MARASKRYKVKGKLGSGARFARLKETLARRKDGVEDPGALAAHIGRQKYGMKRMTAMATKGRKRSR